MESKGFTHLNRCGEEVTHTPSGEAIDFLLSERRALKSNLPRIGILIVSYNASHRLAETVNRIPEPLKEIIEEIFIFDDCSSDDTPQIANDLKSHPVWKNNISIFHNLRNLGYGGNQKLGYRYAIERGLDFVVLIHGDGQYAPEHLGELLLPIFTNRADAVFGSRMLNRTAALSGGMPLYKWLGNSILTSFQNLVLGIHLSEYHSGYRLYSVEALKRIPFENNTDDFHFDSQIIAQLRALNAKIIEVPIQAFYGDEVCHVNGLKYARDVCLSAIDYRLHQLRLVHRNYYCIDMDKSYSRKLSPYGSHQRILSHMSAPGCCLDIGCSSGMLTKDLRQKGIESVGVDLFEPEATRADFKSFIKFDLESCEELVLDEHFDYVLLADVIEHIRNADKLLRHATATLTDDGVVILSTPNIALWFYRLSLLLGRFNYGTKGVLDDTHVHLYTLDSIKRRVERAGLQVVRIDYTGLPFEVVFSSLRKSRLLKIADWFYFQLVRLWPRLFAYQFILIAKVCRAKTANIVEGHNA